jgi:hypothetical protein
VRRDGHGHHTMGTGGVAKGVRAALRVFRTVAEASEIGDARRMGWSMLLCPDPE